MNHNLWQYIVFLEGLGAIGTAAGLAQESLRRNPLKLIGYANLGVLLICISVVANIAINLDSGPTIATWIAAAGFALYGVAASGVWFAAFRLLLRRRQEIKDRHGRRPVAHT